MTDALHDRYCALCWIDGIQSKAVDHWPHMPICEEHLTDSLVRTGTLGWNVVSLADVRRPARFIPLVQPRHKGARWGVL